MAITKELIFDCMEAVKEILPDTKVAVCGGAPRDLLLGRVPSDIDMYITAKNGVDYEAKIKDLSEIFGRASKLDRYRDYLGGQQGLPNLVGIREFNSKEGDKLQIMGFCPELGDEGDLAKSVINTYDFGICMIGYNSDRELVKATYFDMDVAYKTLTLHNWNSLYLLKRSLEAHLPKLKAKYPDYNYSGIPINNRKHNVFKTHIEEAF